MLIVTKKILMIALMLCPTIVFGQTTQWATEIIDFSSEYGSAEYSAEQVMGKPNKLPSYGASSVAWSPWSPNQGEEFIHVGFSKPSYIKQIAIAESFNPGSVTKVYVFDGSGRSQLVFENNYVRPVSSRGRVFSVFVRNVTYKVHAVKVVLKTDRVPGYNHIDAIGISTDESPVKAIINQADIEFISRPKNLGLSINSPYGEVHPLISPDGKTLYFTRKEHPKNLGGEKRDDIWYSIMDHNGDWTKAQNIGAPLNSAGHNFVNAISPDGNMALIAGTYQNHNQSDKLYMSYMGTEGWQKPEEIIIENYYNLEEYNSFHMGVDGKTLLMSLKRKNSLGVKDIYVSFLQSDGSWSEPINCGGNINTAGDEITPFLAPDGKTLYFSSDGFSGYGSNDIYMARRLDNSWTKWSEPLNLGPVINSADWDAYYTVPASGEFAYFTSYKNSYGSGDIFKIRLEEELKPDAVTLLQGKVIDATNDQPIQARVEYQLLATQENEGFVLSSPTDGSYKMVLPKGNSFMIEAKADGYYAVSAQVTIENINKYQEKELDLYMYPIKVGEIIPLENIFFEANKSILAPESFPELNRVAEWLRSNGGIKIEISGHTNNQCSATYCRELSKNRARSVADYLIEKGIQRAQVSFKGYGKQKPIDTNETDAGRKKNQRVEFKILTIG